MLLNTGLALALGFSVLSSLPLSLTRQTVSDMHFGGVGVILVLFGVNFSDFRGALGDF